MIEETHLDELLEIVRDVRAEIVAARAQLARGQLLVADVEQQQRLDGVDVGAALASNSSLITSSRRRCSRSIKVSASR